MFTTVYVSTLREELTGEPLRRLLEDSRRRNAANGITGMLTVRGRRVIQLLEGERASVRELYARIAVDPRHDDVVTVWDSSNAERRFPDWSMAFDDLEEDADKALEQTWPEPSSADLSPDRPGGDDTDYIARRATALRRAMASGDRLVTSLAVILHGHRPQAVLTASGTKRVQCSECRVTQAEPADQYPCNTARNAIWALESTQP
ncbi:BLUF domain-containing protein [Curtobacterium sp. RRHDQ10]|uniref:BLUF domain-containing protein n=1 Tax=Curtobacterium phyllosphaerae TaxID=3413379 RepID=UPI003BF16923